MSSNTPTSSRVGEIHAIVSTHPSVRKLEGIPGGVRMLLSSDSQQVAAAIAALLRNRGATESVTFFGPSGHIAMPKTSEAVSISVKGNGEFDDILAEAPDADETVPSATGTDGWDARSAGATNFKID